MPIRVIIADDHPMIRFGLRMVLEKSGFGISVVGEAADGREALALAESPGADVFILDITMPNLNGLDTARSLLRKFPTSKVVVLSVHTTQAMIEQALAAGARGYLTKDTAPSHAVKAVLEVQAGRRYFSPELGSLPGEPEFLGGELAHSPEPASRLTSQERRILQLIAEGRSNKEIATYLGLSFHTVHTHRNHILSKLGLHSGPELVRWALRAGLAKL